MHCKTAISFLFVMLLFFCNPSFVKAIEGWEENFTTPDKVDWEQTDAYVRIDDEGGYVELPEKSLPSHLTLKESNEYIVGAEDGSRFYHYNDGMEEITSLRISTVELFGVSSQPDEYATWLLERDETGEINAHKYLYNGGYNSDPVVMLGGLKNVVAFDAGEIATAVLSRHYTGKGKIEMEGEIDLEYEIEAEGKPVDISFASYVGNLLYATTTDIYYLSYTGEGYEEELVASHDDIKSISIQNDGSGFVVLHGNTVSYYAFADGQAHRINMLDNSVSGTPVSASIKPGEYEYAVLTQEGAVTYFSYAGDGTTENPFLSVDGLPISPDRYYGACYYYTTPITFENEIEAITITIEDEITEGTEIQYEVLPSDDIEGSTDEDWMELLSEEPLTFTELTDRITIRALLDTEGENTPRITSLSLQGFVMMVREIRLETFPLDPELEELSTPFPIWPEFPPEAADVSYIADDLSSLISPIPVQRGGKVILEVETLGDPEQVDIYIGGTSEYPMAMNSHGSNMFWTQFTIPSDEELGKTYSFDGVELYKEIDGEGHSYQEPQDTELSLFDFFLEVSHTTETSLLNHIKTRLTQ